MWEKDKSRVFNNHRFKGKMSTGRFQIAKGKNVSLRFPDNEMVHIFLIVKKNYPISGT